jgi:hypothetical protein
MAPMPYTVPKNQGTSLPIVPKEEKPKTCKHRLLTSIHSVLLETVLLLLLSFLLLLLLRERRSADLKD